VNYVCNFAEDINIFIVFILKLLFYNLSTQYMCAISNVLNIPAPADWLPITTMSSTYNKATLDCTLQVSLPALAMTFITEVLLVSLGASMQML
jgi:hypothetical protein